MIAWILKKNRDAYEQIMHQECGGVPKIMAETEDKIHVQFCSAATNTWIMLGYWYEMG